MHVFAELIYSFFKENDKFSSFEEVAQKIGNYEDASGNKLWKRSSITVERAAKSKNITRSLDKKLKYYSVKFCCKHGGMKFKSNSTGVRIEKRYTIFITTKPMCVCHTFNILIDI
jgi:hypothetical protein